MGCADRGLGGQRATQRRAGLAERAAERRPGHRGPYCRGDAGHHNLPLPAGQTLSICPDILSPRSMVDLQKPCDKLPSYDSEIAFATLGHRCRAGRWGWVVVQGGRVRGSRNVRRRRSRRQCSGRTRYPTARAVHQSREALPVRQVAVETAVATAPNWHQSSRWRHAESTPKQPSPPFQIAVKTAVAAA